MKKLFLFSFFAFAELVSQVPTNGSSFEEVFNCKVEAADIAQDNVSRGKQNTFGNLEIVVLRTGKNHYRYGVVTLCDNNDLKVYVNSSGFGSFLIKPDNVDLIIKFLNEPKATNAPEPDFVTEITRFFDGDRVKYDVKEGIISFLPQPVSRNLFINNNHPSFRINFDDGSSVDLHENEKNSINPVFTLFST